MNYRSGTEWKGFQIKDDIHIPLKQVYFTPIVTLGMDFNKVETWSKKWDKNNNSIAPYSPGAREQNMGIYTQFFGDIKNGLITATVGLRFDNMTSEILKSSFHPNSIPREETFTVFTPSYGITVSPFKLATNKYSFTLYHNLGKGFVPQSASKIAGYTINKPDATGHVEIFQGNPDLKPEQIITLDGGSRVGFEHIGIIIGLGGYNSIVEQFTEYDYLPVSPGMTAEYNGIIQPVSSIKTYKNNDVATEMAGFEWEFEWNILRLFECKEKLSLSSNGHAVVISEAINDNKK